MSWWFSLPMNHLCFPIIIFLSVPHCEKIEMSCSNWYITLYLVTPVCFSSVQLLSHVRLFATPWTAACQAFLSITSSWSLLKLMSIESVMPSNHLILCCPLLLLPSIFPSIRVFSNELALHIRWPKYWSFSFSISPSNEYSGLISFGLTGLISLQSKRLPKRLFQHHSFLIFKIHLTDFF